MCRISTSRSSTAKATTKATDGHWHPLSVDREVIHVRGGKDVTLDVQSTAHGPLLNPILAKDTRPIALKWTLYDPTLNTIPLYAMDVASNWAEFSAALSALGWPTQNLVYADDQGHIAYHAVGKVPIAGVGWGFSTRQCRTTTDLRYEWGDSTEWHSAYIPFDAHAQRLRSAFWLSGHGQFARDHGKVDPLPLTLRVDRSLSHRAHLQIARGATISRRKTCWPCRPTFTAKWTRSWGTALPTPSTTRRGRRPPAQSRRPDAQLGWAADHRFRRSFHRDADARTRSGR